MTIQRSPYGYLTHLDPADSWPFTIQVAVNTDRPEKGVVVSMSRRGEGHSAIAYLTHGEARSLISDMQALADLIDPRPCGRCGYGLSEHFDIESPDGRWCDADPENGSYYEPKV